MFLFAYERKTLTTGMLLAALGTGTFVDHAFGETVLSKDFEDGFSAPFYNAGGFTSGGDAKPVLTVAGDASGFNSGNALFVESKGTGSEMYLALPEPVVIGPANGEGGGASDWIKASFDFRIDTSTSSQPSGTSSDFRWGFFADADNSLGTAYDGKVFGSEGGDFDGSTGPIGPDFGIHARVPVGNRSGTQARVRTELLGDSGILSGTSQDGGTISSPTSLAPNGMIEGDAADFVVALDRQYNIELVVSRDFAVPFGATDPEEVVRGTLTLTDITDPGSPTVVAMTGVDPYAAAMASSEFHYLVFEDVDEDFDYVIDNVVVSDSTVVPEPAAAALMLSGAMLLLGGWRTRRC